MNLGHVREKYGIMLPRVETGCEYKIACKFNDEIEVTLAVREIGTKTITYDFEILKKNRVAAKGFLKCIAVNMKWRAVNLPNEFVKLVRSGTK